MLGLWSRILRVFWRPDSEGSGGAVVLAFPAVAATPSAQSRPVTAVPVEFIRLSGEETAPVRKPASLHLAARLQSVQRLNRPAGGSRPKMPTAPAGKPKALQRAPLIKSSRAMKPGVVIDRLARPSRRPTAEIVNLANVRRARQVAATDREIAALFN